MAKISKTSVLSAVMALTGKTQSRESKVISLSALAKLTGKTTAYVKEILANNEAALSRDENGRLIGTQVLNAAQARGLLVTSLERTQPAMNHSGHVVIQTFRESNEIIRQYDVSSYIEIKRANLFKEELMAAGKIVCSKFSEIPIDVLVSVWQEDGLLPKITPISENSETRGISGL